MRIASLALLLIACGDNGPIEPPTGEVRRYVMSEQVLPTTNTQTRELAVLFDEDFDDPVAQNQLGVVFSSLAFRTIDAGAASDEQIASGELALVAQVQFPDDATQGIAIELDPTHEPLLGVPTEMPLLLGPGTATIELSLFGEIVPIELAGARVRLTTMNETTISGSIGGGVNQATLDRMIAGFERYLDAWIARECTGTPTSIHRCGCAHTKEIEYEVDYWLDLFDANERDCTLSFDEIAKNSLITSLLTPDVTIDGKQALSFAFGFTATAQ